MTSVINVCRAVAVLSNLKALCREYYWFQCALVSLNPGNLKNFLTGKQRNSSNYKA